MPAPKKLKKHVCMSGKKKKKKYWTTCKTALKAVITCSWLVARVSPQGHAAGSDSPAAALGVPWPFDRELQQGSLTAPQSSHGASVHLFAQTLPGNSFPLLLTEKLFCHLCSVFKAFIMSEISQKLTKVNFLHF